MTQIREKLNSNAGASMMLALGLLMVCVIVSSIIVPAAASGLTRNNKRTAQQREYLAISSASELIVEELKAANTYVGKEEKHVPGCWNYKPANGALDNAETFTVTDTNGIKTYVGYRLEAPLKDGVEKSFLLKSTGGVDDTPFCEPLVGSKITEASSSQLAGNLKVLLMAACNDMILKNSDNIANTDKYSSEFYISVEGETSAESNSNTDRLPKVKCEFTMDTDYNIEIKITSVSGNDGYSVVISMEADEIHKKDESNSGETTATTCEFTHKVLNIYAEDVSGNVKVEVEDYRFTRISDCPTTEITWHDPVVTKGGQK